MSFVAIILTHSRGTLVALVIAVSAFLLIKQRKLLPLFLVAVAVLFLSTPFKDKLDSSSFGERLKINYVSYQVWKDYPLKGIGFGMMTFVSSINIENYVNNLPERYRPLMIHTTHNWLLDIAVRLGIIGFVLFLAILLVAIRMCWKTIRLARNTEIRLWGSFVAISFLAYFVMGLFEPLFLFTAPAMIFYILLGMITILMHLNQETEPVELSLLA